MGNTQHTHLKSHGTNDEAIVLSSSESYDDKLKVLNIINDTAFEILRLTAIKNNNLNSILHDSQTLYQMVLIKSISISYWHNSINYVNKISNVSLEFTDPFSLYPIVRSAFESYCIFNNIYIKNQPGEHREIIHALWAIAALKDRQAHPATIPEHIIKKQQEADSISQLELQIRSSNLYTRSPLSQQSLINESIRKKNYKCYIENDIFKKCAWNEMFTDALNDQGKNNFKTKYNFLSNTTHPSFSSVFQFKSILEENMIEDNIKLIFGSMSMIMSFLISDFCKIFPDAKMEFKKLPDLNQLLVNFYNIGFRGKSFAVSNKFDELHKIYRIFN